MAAPTPFISIVVPVFNGTAFVARAIESVRRQMFSGWELLVIDDASTDSSVTQLTQLIQGDRRIRVFRHRVNRGTSAARNTALARARGAWIAYLDNDDEFYPEYFQHVYEHQDRADMLLFDYDIRDDRPGLPNSGAVHRYETWRWVRALAGDEAMPVPLGVTHRRALLEQVGLFDETLMGEEDRDLWARMVRAGATFEFVRHPSGLYHIRAESVSRTRHIHGGRRPSPPIPPDVETLHDPESEAPQATEPGASSAAAVAVRAAGPARLLFCSYHLYVDPTNGAAWAVRDLLESLVARGRPCGVLCGPDRDARNGLSVAESLRRQGIQFNEEIFRSASAHTRLYHAVVAGLPVTIFDPVDRVRAPEPTPSEESGFLEILREVQTRFRADVMLTYGGHRLARAANTKGRHLGMKVAFWLHNLSYTDPGFFRTADAVLVPSDFARIHYQKAGVHCTAIPGPIRADRVRCESREGRFVTFVNPTPNKGVVLAAQIIRGLFARRPDIPVLIVAARGDVDWLARSRVDLGAVETVHRMPNTPDPREFLRVTRVLLVPSLHAETFGRVAAEAIVNRIPVVASDHEALPETVGQAGVLLPVPERLKADLRAVPTEDEARPWVDAVIRAWEGTGGPPSEAAAVEACDRWSGPRAIARFEDWFDRLAGARTCAASPVYG